MVDATDAARVHRRRRRHDEQLAGAQRAGDLVGPGEQAAETAGERADGGDVGTADEAHGAPVSRLMASAAWTGARA